jgi:hypothetical protein
VVVVDGLLLGLDAVVAAAAASGAAAVAVGDWDFARRRFGRGFVDLFADWAKAGFATAAAPVLASRDNAPAIAASSATSQRVRR